MATYNPSVGSRTALSFVTAIGSLASANYSVTTTALNHDTAKEPDVLVELRVRVGSTPTGNKQAVLFAKGSLDGTNWTTGPESGSTTTDEPDLFFVGAVPINTAAADHTRIFSLAAAFGGRLPKQTKLIVKNDAGVAFTSGDLHYALVTDTVA
jgi:hypothetical protein